MNDMQNKIEYFSENFDSVDKTELNILLAQFVEALNNGIIRCASKSDDGTWTPNMWVKKGILLLFKNGSMHDFSNGNFPFFDKNTIPMKNVTINDNIRIVPGGSSIRTGCYIAKGVICMPPMYINIGSYIDEGTMVDSHALVGTCAQIGKNVHISAAAQIGGVLEPAGARPVIIEDNVMIGGNCGIYEGILVRKGAVMGSGVILTASTKVYDLVNERVLVSTPDKPLEIPEYAVVVSGSRQINTEFGKANGLSIYSPMIIKYRDEKTDAKTALNFDLR